MTQKVVIDIRVHNAAQALEFYKKVLNVKVLKIMNGDEIPKAAMPPEMLAMWEGKIVHSELSFKDNLIYLADLIHIKPNMTHPTTEDCHKVSYTVTLLFDSEKEMQTIFQALSDGGEVIMPITEQFWRAKFGMVKDKFAVTWALNCDLAKK